MRYNEQIEDIEDDALDSEMPTPALMREALVKLKYADKPTAARHLAAPRDSIKHAAARRKASRRKDKAAKTWH